MTARIAPEAHVLSRDAVWGVGRIDRTSTGTNAWRCTGAFEIVRRQDAIFLEEFENPKDVDVLDPRETNFARGTSRQHRVGLLYIESLLLQVPPPDGGRYVGRSAPLGVLDFQLGPTELALEKPRARILIADAMALSKTLEAGILLSEPMRRGKAGRILVATTKAMLTQFKKGMWGRFSTQLVRLDWIGLRRGGADILLRHSPFYHFDRAIVSADTLKQNDWFRHHVEQAKRHAIVIDEAHWATRESNRLQRARIAVLGRALMFCFQHYSGCASLRRARALIGGGGSPRLDDDPCRVQEVHQSSR